MRTWFKFLQKIEFVWAKKFLSQNFLSLYLNCLQSSIFCIFSRFETQISRFFVQIFLISRFEAFRGWKVWSCMKNSLPLSLVLLSTIIIIVVYCYCYAIHLCSRTSTAKLFCGADLAALITLCPPTYARHSQGPAYITRSTSSRYYVIRRIAHADNAQTDIHTNINSQCSPSYKALNILSINLQCVIEVFDSRRQVTSLKQLHSWCNTVSDNMPCSITPALACSYTKLSLSISLPLHWPLGSLSLP